MSKREPEQPQHLGSLLADEPGDQQTVHEHDFVVAEIPASAPAANISIIEGQEPEGLHQEKDGTLHIEDKDRFPQQLAAVAPIDVTEGTAHTEKYVKTHY